MSEKKSVEEPEISSYERDELLTEVVFTGTGSQNVSDRNVKQDFEAVETHEVLKKSLDVAQAFLASVD